jgi:hypothetical protein
MIKLNWSHHLCSVHVMYIIRQKRVENKTAACTKANLYRWVFPKKTFFLPKGDEGPTTCNLCCNYSTVTPWQRVTRKYLLKNQEPSYWRVHHPLKWSYSTRFRIQPKPCVVAKKLKTLYLTVKCREPLYRPSPGSLIQCLHIQTRLLNKQFSVSAHFKG